MNRQAKFIITVSLLLNLLFAGIIAGHAGRFFFKPHDYPGMQDLAAALPADKRELVKATLARAQDDAGELHQQLDDARKKAANLLKAEPFDKDAYIMQVQRIAKLRGQMMEQMAETVAQLATQCTPEERAVLADMLRRPPRPPRPSAEKPID